VSFAVARNQGSRQRDRTGGAATADGPEMTAMVTAVAAAGYASGPVVLRHTLTRPGAGFPIRDVRCHQLPGG